MGLSAPCFCTRRFGWALGLVHGPSTRAGRTAGVQKRARWHRGARPAQACDFLFSPPTMLLFSFLPCRSWHMWTPTSQRHGLSLF